MASTTWEQAIATADHLGINLHGDGFRQIFKLNEWREGQLLPTRERINGNTRKVMLIIATDKKSLRSWTDAQEVMAAGMYQRLIQAREEFLEYIAKKAPRDLRPEPDSKIKPWAWMEIAASLFLFLLQELSYT